MDKLKKIIKSIWKRIYIWAPIVVLFFFANGFIKEYRYIQQLKHEVMDTPEAHAHQFNEIYYAVYDGFSDEVIFRESLTCGVAQGIVFSLAVFYIFFIITCLLSEKEGWKTLGVCLVIISALVLAGWLWFVNNFTLVF